MRFAVDGPVARVTLDRPEVRNAQTPAMWRALARIGAQLSDDVQVIVLEAAGQSFSAGLDRRMVEPDGIPGEPSVADMAAMDDNRLDAVIAGFQSAFTWWRESPAMSIAAVQGHAVGAGFQLALACDLVVCADDARFAMRETSLGLVPDLGGTEALVAAVGYPRALEICATGRWVGAAEAVRLGLATASVPGDDLADAVNDLVSALLSAPPDAAAETKWLLAHALTTDRAGQLAAERVAQARRLRALAGRGAT